MTMSPVESMNCYIKHRSKASTLNNTSRSLMLITEGTDSCIAGIYNSGNVIFTVCVSTRIFDFVSNTNLCIQYIPRNDLLNAYEQNNRLNSYESSGGLPCNLQLNVSSN